MNWEKGKCISDRTLSDNEGNPRFVWNDEAKLAEGNNLLENGDYVRAELWMSKPGNMTFFPYVLRKLGRIS